MRSRGHFLSNLIIIERLGPRSLGSLLDVKFFATKFSSLKFYRFNERVSSCSDWESLLALYSESPSNMALGVFLTPHLLALNPSCSIIFLFTNGAL